MSINQIAEGFYNNLTGKKEDLYEQRIKICGKCKLFRKDSMFGGVCNSRLYLNPETEEVSRVRKEGFYRGCGCVLKSKGRVESAHCPAKKW